MNTALMTELFGGVGRYKALRCLFEHADRAFGTRELATAAGIDAGNASRWLRRWTDIGLLERRTERGLAVFQASKDPALVPLKLLLQQDSEMVQVLRTQLQALGNDVDVAVIFGSAARGETHAQSDIDVLVLGKLSELKVNALLKPVGRKLGRPVHASVSTIDGFKNQIQTGETFARDVVRGPRIALIGDFDATVIQGAEH
jgi:predicted nucleotidyltransferase